MRRAWILCVLVMSMTTAGAAGAHWTSVSHNPNSHRPVSRPTKPNPPVLLGDRRVHAHRDFSRAGRAAAFRFKAVTSGTARTIRVYVSARSRAKKLVAGVYSNRDGRPGVLLGSGSISSPKRSAWNVVHIKAHAVRARNTYWIAVLGKGGTLSFRDRAGKACRGATSLQRSLATLTHSWRMGATRTTCQISAYVSGIVSRLGAGAPGSSGGGSAPAPTPPLPPQPPAPPVITCSSYATTANFKSQVSAAATGQTLCLASGDYGTWSGTNKAITVAAAPGASPTMNIEFGSGASGFTLYGMSEMGGDITSGASNITIVNSVFTDPLVITGLSNANIMLNHDSFNGQEMSSNCSGQPARIHVAYNNGSTPTGVTVENSTFVDPPGGLPNSMDGIQTGSGMVIRNNVFENILDNGGCNHQDSIQAVNATGVVVIGNLFINDEDGFVDLTSRPAIPPPTTRATRSLAPAASRSMATLARLSSITPPGRA